MFYFVGGVAHNAVGTSPAQKINNMEGFRMTELRNDLMVEDMRKKMGDSIGIDDKFETGCQACDGYCKKSRVTIIMTPYDIYRASKELNMKVPDFINKYCRISIGFESKLPVVTLNRGAKGKCILLRNGVCITEKDKPLSCALFPLEMFKDDKKNTTTFFVNNVNGHGEPVTYTVRQWLDVKKIDPNDSFYSLWGKLLTAASPLRQEMLEYVGFDRTIQAENQMIIHLMYGAYDTDKDFLTQFIKNSEVLIENLNKMLGVCRMLNVRKDEY